ncbi:hypothetical protein H6G69_19500 [Nostoc sp. FACHB-110]|nr:hypothetical protein [Nostoc sp. FACHB-110]
MIDNILAEVKTDIEEQATSKNLPTPPNYQLIKPNLNQLPPDILPSFIAEEPQSKSVIDNILAEVKADVEEQAAAEELQKQEQLKQERLRQAKIKAQKLEALRKKAQAWLDKLDPFSAEGLWFERFAEGYPSKLDAAIEYLQDNQ